MLLTTAVGAPPVALSSAVAFFRGGPGVSPFSRSFIATPCGGALCRKVSQFLVISDFAAVTSAGAVAAAAGGVVALGAGFSSAAGLLLPPPQPAARAARTRRGATRRTRLMIRTVAARSDARRRFRK